MTDGPRPGLEAPDIDRTEGGIVSRRFGDIYFQPGNGLAESRHVFVDGNDLGERFARLSGPSPFVIGELGFGTGLNVLAAAETFLRTAPAAARLDIFSVEGFPFQPGDLSDVLTQMAAEWPDIAPLARSLARAYPRPRPGLAAFRLDERITVTLFFGEAQEAFDRCDLSADAWFLDGFSPAANPAMWTPALLSSVYDCTRPGGTAATFTVAGGVRRALEAAGFALSRRPGFGRKREMLTATRGTADNRAPAAPNAPTGPVAVVGAGIAGACMAATLRAAGLTAIVIDRQGPAAGASGNPGGLVAPRFEAADNAAARFYRDAWLYALRFYGAACPAALDRTGSERRMEGARAEKILATHLWAEGDLEWRSDTGALYAADGAVLDPRAAVAALLGDTPVMAGDIRALRAGASEEMPGPLTAAFTDGRKVPAAAVVICAGTGLGGLVPALRGDLSASRGQVDLFSSPVPDRIISEGHYVAPLNGALLCGATYDVWDGTGAPTVTENSTATNAAAAAALLATPPGSHVAGRAALRTVTPDRHPVAGPYPGSGENAPPSVWILGGLGSRGLVTAPLLAQMITQQIVGGVIPVERAGTRLVSMDRFAERRRRRGGA